MPKKIKKHGNNKSQITIYKDGELLVTSQAVHENCMESDGTFMPDYIWDERGGLQELHYDMIAKSK